MAKNYEAICESMRLAGEQKLLKLSNIFQEHQHWLKQAFEDARAHLVAQKDPSGAKTQQRKCASDKENAPAPKHGNRKRSAPAAAMDTITEEAQPEEDARPEPDAKQETEPEARPEPEAVLQTGLDSTEQEAAPAERSVKGKPPLPSRARRGRTAKGEGTDADAAGKQAGVGEDNGEPGTAAAWAVAAAAEAAPPATANPGRRTTRRTARSAHKAAQLPAPQRQTRRAAAMKAAAAIAADASTEEPATGADAAAPAEDTAPVKADRTHIDSAEEQAIAVREAEKLPVEDAAPPAAASEEQVDPQKPRRGRQAKGGSKRQDSDSKADAADTAAEAQQVLEPVAGGDESQRPSQGAQAKGASKHQASGRKADAEDAAAESAEDPEPSSGPPRAQRAGKRIAKSATDTPAQSKQPAAPAPRTSRRMAAAGRAAEPKTDVQAHRLELSDEDSDDEMHEAHISEAGNETEENEAGDNMSPAVYPDKAKEAQKDEEKEATPQVVEETPTLERAVATAARPKRAAAAAAQKEVTPQVTEGTPLVERAVATAARPKRAAAAAAQRAIAATAVKRQRGRNISGASFASVPGTTRRTRQAAAAEEEARASPAAAGSPDAADEKIAELQAMPANEMLAEEQAERDDGKAPDAQSLQEEPESTLEAAESIQRSQEQHAAHEVTADWRDTTSSIKPAKEEAEDPTPAGRVAAAEPEQTQEAAEVDEEDDIGVDEFQEAQDVFETPSQHPRSMTPGTSFGTARQQPTAYKTGQEHLTGVQPSTGKPIFIRPELKNGPLARAAAAAAQRPAMPGVAQAAQPMGSDQANEAAEPDNAQQGGVVGRLKQQYEGKAVMGSTAAKRCEGDQRKSLPVEEPSVADASAQPPAEAEDARPAGIAEGSQVQKGPTGMGANLVSAVRSFLPFVSKAADAQLQPAAGKKPVKVKALEAADAARKKEVQKAAERAAQRQQVEAQKAERAKRAHDAKAAQAEREEEARRLAQEALNKKEEEAAARRHAKEEVERKEREDRQKRQEELRQKRKQAEQEKAATEEKSRKAAHEEEERKRKTARQQEMEAKRPRLQGPSAQAKPAPAAVSASSQAAAPAAKQAGADLPGPTQHTSAVRPVAAESAADLASRPATAMPIHGMVKPSTPVAEIAEAGTQSSGTAAAQQGRTDSEQFQSYELSPYKSGSESDDSDDDAERRKKPIPKWARGQALTQALVAQMAVDPDEIFKLHQKTCPLNEVFSNKTTSDKHPRKDLNRRTSSGNWIEDRVTWKEELNYKKAMGYL